MTIQIRLSKELTNTELNIMYNIIINNLEKIFDNFESTDDDKIIWMDSIKNHDYNFILAYDCGNLVGYLEYIKLDDGYFISEIQIDDDHKGDRKTFKLLIKQFYNIIFKDKNIKIFANINKENKKSVDVFTHIGMKHIENKLYQINSNDLGKWCDKA